MWTRPWQASPKSPAKERVVTPQLSQNKGRVRLFKGWGVPQGEGPATHTGLWKSSRLRVKLVRGFHAAPAPTAEAALCSADNREPALVRKEHTLPNCASGLLQEHVKRREAEYLARQIQAKRNKSPEGGSRQETGNRFLHL